MKFRQLFLPSGNCFSTIDDASSDRSSSAVLADLLTGFTALAVSYLVTPLRLEFRSTIFDIGFEKDSILLSYWPALSKHDKSFFLLTR